MSYATGDVMSLDLVDDGPSGEYEPFSSDGWIEHFEALEILEYATLLV